MNETSAKFRSVTLRVWRQPGPGQPGRFVEYKAEKLNRDMSFLEMLDVVNDGLAMKGEEPIAFAHDCREGICGTCSLVIDGKPHGPHRGIACCQTYLRSFEDGAVITVEPYRVRAFPVVKDLITDRSAFDRIQQAGGFITARTGSAPDANAIPIPKDEADLAMDAAQCIGCGACAAACKNAERDAVRRGQGVRISGSFRRGRRSATGASWPWSRPWTTSDSAAARTNTSAARPARS